MLSIFDPLPFVYGRIGKLFRVDETRKNLMPIRFVLSSVVSTITLLVLSPLFLLLSGIGWCRGVKKLGREINELWADDEIARNRVQARKWELRHGQRQIVIGALGIVAMFGAVLWSASEGSSLLFAVLTVLTVLMFAVTCCVVFIGLEGDERSDITDSLRKAADHPQLS